MSHPDEGSSGAPVPAVALLQATEELYDIEDAEVIAQSPR